MKLVILAGGLGTRIAEETHLRPKPMVEIGGKPILWHLMKIYASHGITDFIICCGYKGYVIKEYFVNYGLHQADVSVDLASGQLTFHRRQAEDWRVTLVDTGEFTMTGGRLKRVRSYLNDSPFCFTYGDGLADVDISALIRFHQSHGRLATVTAVQPPGRYGRLDLDYGDTEIPLVSGFLEKPHGDGDWINGGFFVLDPSVIDRIDDDQTSWEQGPLGSLALDGELRAWRHTGFWQPMDTLRERQLLESLWQSGDAPWKCW
jgi:glucose-1-phosphate cytidylyltransferase